MAKTEVVQQNANRRRLETRFKRQVKLHGEPRKSVLWSFFYSFALFHAKRLKMKAFALVNLVSLTLRSCTAFKNF